MKKPTYMPPSPLKQLKFRMVRVEKRVEWLESEVKRLERDKAEHELIMGGGSL